MHVLWFTETSKRSTIVLFLPNPDIAAFSITQQWHSLLTETVFALHWFEHYHCLGNNRRNLAEIQIFVRGQPVPVPQLWAGCTAEPRA